MPFRVEIYAADGVAIAVVARSGSLREIVESGSVLLLESATWHPIDGSPPGPVGELSLGEALAQPAVAVVRQSHVAR